MGTWEMATVMAKSHFSLGFISAFLNTEEWKDHPDLFLFIHVLNYLTLKIKTKHDLGMELNI